LTLAALVLASCFFVVLALGSAFIVTAIGRLFRKRGRDGKESTSVAETRSLPASFRV
jgi:hypothetical protein